MGRGRSRADLSKIESGEVAPLDGEQVLKEMRQLAKQLAQQ